MSVKVNFKWHGTFWLVDESKDLDSITDGAIAHLDPELNGLDDEGNIINPFAGRNSYAHLLANGNIIRSGHIIGTKADLTQAIEEQRSVA